jgi:hypothetical protein
MPKIIAVGLHFIELFVVAAALPSCYRFYWTTKLISTKLIRYVDVEREGGREGEGEVARD